MIFVFLDLSQVNNSDYESDQIFTGRFCIGRYVQLPFSSNPEVVKPEMQFSQLGQLHDFVELLQISYVL